MHLAAEWAKLAQGVSSGAITRAMLSAEIQAGLNWTGTTFTPHPGSITGAMLTPTVLSGPQCIDWGGFDFPSEDGSQSRPLFHP